MELHTESKCSTIVLRRKSSHQFTKLDAINYSCNPTIVGGQGIIFCNPLILDTNLLLETAKMFSSIDYLNDFVLWVFLCHQFNLSWTYYIIQGALNVVMGNAPEIGDALLQSTQVLFRPILSCICTFLCLYNMSSRNTCGWHYNITFG